jgi:hypothetical protein
MSYRILILASAAVFGVCDGPADDDPLATCDRIAEKYVAAFAAKDVEGPAREKALDKCVLGPEQDYTDAGRTWVACMESAASPAQMVKCQKEFQATLVNEKLSTIGGDDPRGEGDGLRRDDEGGRNDRAPDRGQRGRFRENRRGVRRANRDCQERDGWTRCRAVEDRALQIDLEGLFPDHENRPSRRSYEHSGQIRPLLWFGAVATCPIGAATYREVAGSRARRPRSSRPSSGDGPLPPPGGPATPGVSRGRRCGSRGWCRSLDAPANTVAPSQPWPPRCSPAVR